MATFSAAFILVALWIIESFEPQTLNWVAEVANVGPLVFRAATGKVEKYRLRERGVTPDTVDTRGSDRVN